MKVFVFIMSCVILLIGETTFAQESFRVTVRVNGNLDDTVYHNAPVIVTVSLINFQASDNKIYNDRATSHLRELQQQYEKGRISREEFVAETLKVRQSMRDIKAVTLGTIDEPWFKRVSIEVFEEKAKAKTDLPIHLLKYPEPHPVAVLNESNYYFAEFGIDPDELAKVKPGIYRLKAFLAGEESKEAILRVLAANYPASKVKSNVTLLRFGQYYYQAGDLDKGISYAERILRQDKNSIDALVLRADVYTEKGLYKEALVDFEGALKLFGKQYRHEVPEYLIGSIRYLKEKLGITE